MDMQTTGIQTHSDNSGAKRLRISTGSADRNHQFIFNSPIPSSVKAITIFNNGNSQMIFQSTIPSSASTRA